MLDLSPFGFTPTESSAYRTLLQLGPSTGYAVARALTVARANAYQALDGLVAKRAAAVVSEGAPKRYRATQPTALLAHILEVEARRIDRLEAELLAQPPEGGDLLVTLTTERSVHDTAVRAIVRAEGDVLCLAGASDLLPLVPALRTRAVGGRPVRVWSPDPADLPVEVGRADGNYLTARFGAPPMLLVADGALMARSAPTWSGVWSSDHLWTGLVRSAMDAAVSSQG